MCDLVLRGTKQYLEIGVKQIASAQVLFFEMQNKHQSKEDGNTHHLRKLGTREYSSEQCRRDGMLAGSVEFHVSWQIRIAQRRNLHHFRTPRRNQRAGIANSEEPRDAGMSTTVHL
ncbi:hypothetical protein CEK69_11070 [Xanthomonas sp. LMG 12462]|nr:hypothetical protein CEK69_11070 [Xanthomonas sp. LMG 12462]